MTGAGKNNSSCFGFLNETQKSSGNSKQQTTTATMVEDLIDITTIPTTNINFELTNKKSFFLLKKKADE